MMLERAQFNQEFGRRVRAARKRAGMRAEAAAEAAGISPQFLSDVERGVKGMGNYNVARLAQALGVSSDALLFGASASRGQAEEMADYLRMLQPATLDMAAHMLSVMLGIVKEYQPEWEERA